LSRNLEKYCRKNAEKHIAIVNTVFLAREIEVSQKEMERPILG
jgi:hypothetical protein